MNVTPNASFAFVLCATIMAALIAACGGDNDPSTAASGDGGQGGSGGVAPTSASVATSTGASSTTALGSSTAETSTAGGTGGGSSAPNGCAELDFKPLPDDNVVVSNGTMYVPRCFEVDAGDAVFFVDDFVTHPLVGGFVIDGDPIPDPKSPIRAARTGEESTVVFDEPGDFGFYCENHATLEMMGVARVR